MDVGSQIRAIRRSKDLSQEAVASLVGVTSAYISKIENGKTDPSSKLLGKIAEALKVPVVRFFSEDLRLEGIRSVSTVPDEAGDRPQTLNLPYFQEVPMDLTGEPQTIRGRELSLRFSPSTNVWLEVTEELARRVWPFIAPGTAVLLSKTETPKSGDIVAFRDGEEQGLGTYASEERMILSFPPAFAPLHLTARAVVYKVSLILFP